MALITGTAWVPAGPSPAINGQVENVTSNDEVVGAIHTVVAHPASADTLWIGAVNGGIWRTDNATAGSPTWTPQTDTQSSLSIGAMELDPTDGTNQTLVAGIARRSSFGSTTGGARTGLLRTANGGTTWSAMTGGGTLTGKNISGVAPRGSTFVVSVDIADSFLCSNIGIFRSINGGASFAQVTSGIPQGACHDLVGDPSNSAVLYTSVVFADTCLLSTNGVFRSADTGATWSRVSDATMDALLISSTTNNVELAVGNSGEIYCAILNFGQMVGIFRSGNSGASWTQMDLPLTPQGAAAAITNATNATPIVITSASHGLIGGERISITGVTGNTAANGVFIVSYIGASTFSLNGSVGNGAYISGGAWTDVVGVNPRFKPDAGLPGSQGSIHFSIAADPSNANTVYIGGDRQDFPNFIGATDWSGQLWRGDASVGAANTAPSPQWEHLTHSNAVGSIPAGGTASGSAPHADSREMVFDVNGDIIEVDDGGIYRHTNPTDNTGDWVSLCGDLQVTEQHDIAYDTVSDILISGNQDTGTTQQQTTGGTTWDSVHTGDGGDVAVDDTTTPGRSFRYSSFQNLGTFRRREYNAANAFQAQAFPALAGGIGSFTANFVSPVEINAANQARLVIGGANGILESLDMGATSTYLATTSINNDCLAYGTPATAEVLYAGSGSAVLVRLSGAGAPVATATPYPGGSVTDLAINPNDGRHLFVTDQTAVYETTDAGTTWTNLTGTLTETNIRSLVYLSAFGEEGIAVGTGHGVWAMELASPGTWTLIGTGLPNAPVYDLDYDATDNVLIAGTMGRGAWTLPSALIPVELSVFGAD